MNFWRGQSSLVENFRHLDLRVEGLRPRFYLVKERHKDPEKSKSLVPTHTVSEFSPPLSS